MNSMDDKVGQTLTSADPEPPPGTTVTDCFGKPWTRDGLWEVPLGCSSWTRDDVEDDPESWIKVAGNYGPVKVIEWGGETDRV